jgi:hypothetical protein
VPNHTKETGLGVLRALLLIAGLALLAAGAALAGLGCGVLPGLRLAIPGLILVGAALVERWRYKRIAVGAPGAGWVATVERFVDPESGKLVTVYFQPSTGERRYVAAGAARLDAPPGSPSDRAI